jgi:hypothetical protein
MQDRTVGLDPQDATYGVGSDPLHLLARIASRE